MSGVLHGVAAVARPVVVEPYLLTTTTYSQSDVYPDNNAATWEYMNNNNADGSANNAQTGSVGASSTGGAWVKAELGSTKYVDRIVIGYDYLTNLPGGWGVYYTNGVNIEGSTDDSTWATITTAPVYNTTGSSNGLVEIPIDGNWGYIRLRKPHISVSAVYLCTLEFQIWVT